MKNLLILMAIVSSVLSQAGFAADYAREKKWAEEVVPGVVVGDAVYLMQANQHEFLTLYTPANNAKSAVVDVHGRGVHPDWGMIGVLRSSLADEGYTTLSVQMPVLNNDARDEDYVSTLPEAKERIALAVDFLKGKGYSRIAIVSHSLGSWMTYAYLTNHPDSAIKAWVAIGVGAKLDFSKLKLPVLDLFGDNDLPEVLANATARKKALEGKLGSQQLMLPKADHFYTGMDKELVKTVKDYLDVTFK